MNRPWKLRCVSESLGDSAVWSRETERERDEAARLHLETWASLGLCKLEIQNPGEEWKPYQIAINDTGKP